ncbi:MAG: 16S rRNA (guanine(527)-N(7))-methyltransferase RsmG [Raoultibacter sp.]|jgi:16S rRNA (guanine527-N7)-methyltransferase
MSPKTSSETVDLVLSSFPKEEQMLIEWHLELVIQANKTHNLTRITSPDDALILHIEDSLTALQELKNAPDGAYADLGTGGGFPGIPLAITTHRKTLLVDSVKKKAAVLSQIIDDLELSSGVSVYSGRIEELALDHPEHFAVLTARALSSLPSLLELAAPLLKEGGHLVCYKANIENSEKQHAISLEHKLGLRLLSEREISLSNNYGHRQILVFEKYKNPEISLPRRIGIAQKRPLS